MIKNAIIIISFLLLLTGCVGNNAEDSFINGTDIVSDEVVCRTDDSNFKLIFENGQIVKYIDFIDGDLGQEIVDILNSEHLIGVNNNDDALIAMNDALRNLNGFCEKSSFE